MVDVKVTGIVLGEGSEIAALDGWHVGACGQAEFDVSGEAWGWLGKTIGFSYVRVRGDGGGRSEEVEEEKFASSLNSWSYHFGLF